eukprot:scaffold1089_cov117-Cylindrotheca_fusiformis.AAC.15
MIFMRQEFTEEEKQMQFHGPLLVLCCVASALPFGQEGSLVLCSIRPSFGSEGVSEMESKAYILPYHTMCVRVHQNHLQKEVHIRRKVRTTRNKRDKAGNLAFWTQHFDFARNASKTTIEREYDHCESHPRPSPYVPESSERGTVFLRSFLSIRPSSGRL